MTEMELSRINDLSKRIKELELNIKSCEFSQSENVVIRGGTFNFNAGSIEVPKELFRLIGKLVLAENTIELLELKHEFKNL